MPKIQLTERDEELLKLIAKYGVISINAARYIYQTKKYHENRITVLSRAGYVTRSNGVKLARKGKEYVKKLGIEVRNIQRSASYQNRVAAISELALIFEGSGLEFMPSWDAKSELNLSGSSKALGAIKNDMLTIVYALSENTTQKSINTIKSEMQTLQTRGIGRAVILAENKAAMDKFPVEAIGLSEQLLLPWTEYGINLLITHIKEDLRYKSAKMVLGEVYPPRWTLADYYDSNDKPVVVLTLNDLEKRAKLESYYRITSQRHTGQQQVTLICLQSQLSVFSKEFPNANIQAIPDNAIL